MMLIETIYKKIVDAIYKDSGVRIYIEYNVDGLISVIKAEHDLSKRIDILGYVVANNKTQLLEKMLFRFSPHQYHSMSLFDILRQIQSYPMIYKNVGGVELTDIALALNDSMICKKLCGIRKCDSVEELALEMDLIGI